MTTNAESVTQYVSTIRCASHAAPWTPPRRTYQCGCVMPRAIHEKHMREIRRLGGE